MYRALYILIWKNYTNIHIYIYIIYIHCYYILFNEETNQKSKKKKKKSEKYLRKKQWVRWKVKVFRRVACSELNIRVNRGLEQRGEWVYEWGREKEFLEIFQISGSSSRPKKERRRRRRRKKKLANYETREGEMRKMERNIYIYIHTHIHRHTHSRHVHILHTR